MCGVWEGKFPGGGYYCYNETAQVNIRKKNRVVREKSSEC
ncbi:ORF8 [Barthadenovirus mellis]|uniref:ORF8 n=1 Tax=Passerine adenovirus 1 TaxID=2779174 RepID=A0A7L9DI14_9ADEN|nr:ORF8 [Passerine adenovirus 1]